MGQGYLLDANLVIDYIGNILPVDSRQKINEIIDDNFNISVVVKIEVLGYNDLPTEIKQLEVFIDLAFVGL